MSSDTSAEPILIPIVCDDDNSSTDGDNGACSIPEWAMIEVNGELVLPSDLLVRDHDSRPRNGKENHSSHVRQDGSASQSVVSPNRIELGSLRFVDKKPVMIIGSHELTGKGVETLAKPFCVLQKSDDESSYHVKGVVTRKVLLNQYPKVIMR